VVGFLVGTREIRCGGAHKTKTHVVTPLSCLSGMFGRTLSSLFLDVCFLFPANEAKRVVLETGRNASDVAR